MAAPSFAATYNVNTTSDTTDAAAGNGSCADAGGQCSLRAAVQEANASAGVDSIQLPGGTFTLSIAGATEDGAATGDLDITDNLVIDGGQASAVGGASTVDAAGIDRIFDVISAPSENGSLTNVTLRNLTLVNGAPPETESGGAVRSNGSLSVQGSALRRNAVTGTGASGGGVFNDDGSLSILGSELFRNSAARAGGGIEANSGFTIIDNSDLRFNRTGPSPGNGGGLHLTGEGTVFVQSSAVEGNRASAEGGGLWNSSTGTLSVFDTRIVGNTAEGALADNGGGGVFSDGGDTTIQGGRIVGNSATGAAGSGGGVMIVTTLEQPWLLDIDGTLLRRNSASRAGGGIEVRAGSTEDRADLDDVMLEDNSTGAAPGNGGGLHVTSVNPGGGNVTIDDSTVVGNTAAAEGGGLWNDTGRMSVTDTAVVRNTASGALADNGGGGLFNNGGDLTVTDGRVTQNSANGSAGSGGGILSETGGDLSVVGTLIRSNSATRAGGGVEIDNASVDAMGNPLPTGVTSLESVMLKDNTTGPAPGNGGALHVTGGGTVDVSNSTVARNVASQEGGGLWNGSGTMTVTNTVVVRNQANGNDATMGGGGLFNNGGTLNVVGGRISLNDADGTSGSGGGILNDSGTLTVGNTEISKNSASRAGGGIESIAGTVDLDGVDLLSNDTGPNPGNGGALHLSGDGTVTIDGGRIRNNDAANEGGGVWNSPNGIMTLTGVDIGANTARPNGGPNAYQEEGGTGTLTVNGQVVPPGDPGI